MHDGRVPRGTFGLGHGAAPYPVPPRRASGAPSRGARALAVLAIALLAATRTAEAAPPSLKADGSWQGVEVKAPGGKAEFRAFTVSGCRYRLTAEPGTLGRPQLEVDNGPDPVARVDAGEDGGPAIHVWDAQGDEALTVRVGGFSAQMGKARVRLETLSPDGAPVSPHRRMLRPDAVAPRVGELLLGGKNRWELVVEPGKAYEVTSTRGTAGRVVLSVLRADGTPIAVGSESSPSEPVAFQAPAAPPTAPDEPVTSVALLEVRAVWGAGGTYGVKLSERRDATVPPPPIVDPLPEVAPGLLEDVPLGFRANAGDVAVLHMPPGAGYDGHWIESAQGGRWARVEGEGEGATARTPQRGGLAWFRPHRAGSWRFSAPPPGRGAGLQVRVYVGTALGGAPLLLGTGVDPSVKAKTTSAWQTLGIGVVAPGADYIFVAVGAPLGGVALRATEPGGKTIASRPAQGEALPQVAGMGPSLRFRVTEPSIVRLEARGGTHVVYALLRQASN
jgi:hypothetical protein